MLNFFKFNKVKGSVLLFNATDAEGMANDIGNVRLIKERVAVDENDMDGRFPIRRCAMFEIVDVSSKYKNTFNYLVAILYSDTPIADYKVGAWVDGKAISGFSKLDSAEAAYSTFGPSYLSGERLSWSVFKRIK